MSEQHRVDRQRVRGYALACCTQALVARRTMDVVVDKMVRAQAEAEQWRRQWEHLSEQAELAARVFSSGDEAWIAEVATHLEELFG